MGVEAAIRRSFAEAADYAKKRKEDPLLRRDLRLEALADILDGEVLVHCHSYRSDEILMILQVAKDHKLRLATLQHVLEGYKVGPEIAALGAGASTFSDWWAYKFEVWDAIPHNAALMTRQGVLVSINSDSPEQIRHLAVEAAKTMKYGGLSEAEALATVTINPARQLGIGSRTGSLEPGKDADVALFNGHPLSPYSRCVATSVDGEWLFDARAGAVGHPTPGFKPEERQRLAPLALPKGAVVAIAGARIHPVTSEPFEGTIVVENGRIAALGADAKAPPGAEVVDGRGLSVYPGLVSCLSTLGLTEIGSIAGSVDLAEIGGVQPDLKALTAVNPHSELIPVARANGITSVLVAPQAGTIAGESSLIRLDGWTPAEMAVKDGVALHVNYPDLAGTDDHKAGDEKKRKALKTPFEDAKRYTGVPRDLGLEAMQPYVKGERPVVIHAQKAAQIRGALAFAKEFGLKAVIAGGLESWKVAPLLAEAKVPVLLSGVMTVPLADHDPYDSTFATPARLAKAGVDFALSASVEEWHGNTRNLPYHAAWAAAYGLDRKRALEAVTIAPARILGASDRIGSLEVGKDADLIVTTGDPLEVLTDVVLVMVRGRAVPLDNRQSALYDKFRSRPK
jgi:imidazolonepropionase-like amidohydrolase